MSHRRIILGAVLGATALAAVPSAANAASTCTFDPVKRQMTVQHESAGRALTLLNGSTLQYRDGSSFAQSCYSTTGQPATPSNTDRVTVKASANPAGYQEVVIDERNGDFSESNANLDFLLLTGTGNDKLSILQGGASDWSVFRETPAGGPAVDLDADGDLDINMTLAGSVAIDTGSGSDVVDATRVYNYRVGAFGNTGDDWLYGGAKSDTLDGGPDNDHLFSKGDRIADYVTGGPLAGFDEVSADYGIDQYVNVDKVGF